MPPFSASIGEEGVLIDNFKLVDRGKLREAGIARIAWAGGYPARNPAQNLADIRAQIAANATGGAELKSLVAKYGVATVMAYMQHVQDNAEESVRGAITALKDGRYTLPLDNGACIQVSVRIDPELRCGLYRLHRQQCSVAGQFQRAARHHHGCRAVRVSHAGER